MAGKDVMRFAFVRSAGAALAAFLAAAGPAAASAAGLDGAHLPWPLALPFAGILLSIAFGPLLVKEWWHIHYAKAAAFWAGVTLAGLAAVAGVHEAATAVVHDIALEYIPFILMLFALFTAAGGINISGKLRGGPVVNSAILALGASIASLIGTTGASMVLLRPLIRANESRRMNAHVVVFFIFLVSNIGGALTPLGDPPLFLGFLEGVDFFWTMKNLWPATLFACLTLLAIFFLMDRYFLRRERTPEEARPALAAAADLKTLRIGGSVNIALIGVAIAAIVASGLWRPGTGFDILGVRLELQNIVREGVMICVGLASLALTNKADREANGFEWEPIREVAYLFAGIFVCIVPVMAMLHAGAQGPFARLIELLSRPDGTPNNPVFFWTTGVLSSFLDNAPTYLVFFQLAGGDPATLMGPLAPTLAAISLGAVFMGANTYIGNAPNFMVYAIARRAGVRMPGFFPYMLWSGAILLPLFLAVTWLFMPNPPLRPKEPAPAIAAAAAPSADPTETADARTQEIEELRRQLRALQDEAAAAESRNRELEGKLTAAETRQDKGPPKTTAGLARARADFFAKLTEALGDRTGVGARGGRFVLASRLLFDARPATLDASGRAVLDAVAAAVLSLEQTMPRDVPWIVRVDGHADSTPVRSKQFASNWALSFERANAVVQYLIARGVSPQRLVAGAFGEFQPPRAQARDGSKEPEPDFDARRIELTLTER
ncbi:Na+/H+ antiporter NhaD [Methylocapsa palsarum]|uniref:Na+/H+ antiporter NhaD n=2 Tax=Methylocapsa palsarum TaxID=1612308 RepID=A0A1I3Z8N6_9HYPH|nr:Na+/H+ antiporter NhaD [Methylocapsa palsarum]